MQPENRVQARVGISGKNVRKRRNFAVSDFPCHSVRLRCQSSFSAIRDMFTQPFPYGPVGLPPLKSTAQPGSKPGSGRHLLITFPSCTLGWDGTLFFSFWHKLVLAQLPTALSTSCPSSWRQDTLGLGGRWDFTVYLPVSLRFDTESQFCGRWWDLRLILWLKIVSCIDSCAFPVWGRGNRVTTVTLTGGDGGRRGGKWLTVHLPCRLPAWSLRMCWTLF